VTIAILRGDQQVPRSALSARTVAVIGYGNQGAAHALNLRDSGVRVVVGAREGVGSQAARDAGFDVQPIERAVTAADFDIMALPDEAQPEVMRARVLPHIRPGVTLGFIHGFCVHFKLLPPLPDGVGVVMVAPKGPGRTLRARYVAGQGIPCLLAVHQESSRGDARALALAWANGIGCARAGVILTTFRDETETDLFGEQTVLVGGMTWLILAAFETLVEAGYPPELAYLECCHEAKQIADLVYERGITGMMQKISNTAEFGAYKAGPMMVNDAARAKMRELLRQVQDGSFARDLRADYEKGFPWFASQRAKLADHPIEPAGKAVRDLMPWLATPDMGGAPPPDPSQPDID